jgi:hypothetical protein
MAKMANRSLLLSALGCCLLASSPAYAECTELPRKVSLGQHNTIVLRSYECGIGRSRDSGRLKVEFHRFSDTAASLIVGNGSSEMLKKTIGSPRLVENEVFKAYAELLQRFGSTSEVPKEQGEIRTSLSVKSPAGDPVEGMEDLIGGKKMRTVIFNANGQDYPAAEEIAALRKKTIPSQLKFFYGITCLDDDDNRPDKKTCKDYDKANVSMIFWRPLRPEDLANYSKNIKDYNSQLTRFKAELRSSGKRSTTTDDPWSDRGLPRDLKLFQFLAGDAWPDDFVYLTGNVGDACGENTIKGVGGWSFSYTGWTIHLDAVLFENASNRPVRIGGLFGSRAVQPRLRAARSARAATDAAGPLGDMTEELAPGQKLLIPIRITLVADPAAKKNFQYVDKSSEILGRLGTNKFSGSPAAHAAPGFRDYVFGPELAVAGVLVDGDRVDLQRQQANFFDLTVSSQVGSCPYLTSWSGPDREWIEHGKVLHEAAGKIREYSETFVLPGLRSRFRLEEREPEIAFIDHAELVVTLANGDTIVLQPDKAPLDRRDGDYLSLMWGDAIEIEFALDDRITEADVVDSRLTLTGYYERYSSLLAVRGEDVLGRSLRRSTAGSPSPAYGPACLPRQPRPRADRFDIPARPAAAAIGDGRN